LSVRITIAFALGGLLISTSVVVIAYVFAYRFLVHQQEHDAQRQSYLGAAVVRDQIRAGTKDVPAVLDALTPGSTSTPAQVVVDDRGRWYSSSLLVSRDSLPMSLRTQVLAGSPHLMWIRINAAPQLVIAIPIPSADAAYFGVIDESSLARTLSTLRHILLAAAGATTAAGAALGLWASRRLTRPLRAVSRASAQISAGRLDTRLGEEDDADLAGLVNSFNGMVDTLRARIERDTRFAADVSHELRSPLTTLRTSMSVLEGRRNELSERNRDTVDLMTIELGRFNQLVDDLLEISRSDAGAPNDDLEAVRVSELVLNLLQQPEYAAVPVNIDVAALDATVLADKRRLQQAVRNLLRNADVHGGGAVEVRVERAAEHVSITIDDAGPGVDPAEHHRVFERFARGSRAGRRGSGRGSGLGLALVREHVRAHDGSVRVSERPGGGARFVIELPAIPE
jgi:signal transduction histidine kinase